MDTSMMSLITHQLLVSPLPPPTALRTINGYRIKLQLWDTAGQERYVYTHARTHANTLESQAIKFLLLM